MKNKNTLADKIAGILNTAPSTLDLEEDAVDATNARVLLDENDTEDVEEEDKILSKFRKENISLLEDLDEKYAGKKTTRKNLRDSDDDSFDETSDIHSEESGESTEEEEDENDEAESEEEYADDDDDGGDEDTNFKHINDTNVSKHVKKGICLRNQLAMWENLLEIRIQLQKCLVVANKMPPKAKFHEIKEESGAEFSNPVSETKNNLSNVLNKLLLLQKLLLKQFPETKNLNKGNDSDEEIPSDTEPEQSEDEEVDETPKKRKKLEEYEHEINEHHKKYKDYGNSTIQKWNDKTRLIAKSGATSHSILDQIEYSLSNKEKLIKRTQLKRSRYDIVGETSSESKENEITENYNPEIFDDDDFYHQLLRELIEVKSADVTDPVQLGRQWIQLQHLRSKMKRKIDTRATKGRKIRYAVHNKLVNFMAPIDENLWTDEAKTELYNSLFGKKSI